MPSKANAQHWYNLSRISSDMRKTAKSEAIEVDQLPLFERMLEIQAAEKEPGYLHSAFAVMSLPASRPKDETQPIVRNDGEYTLMIAPRHKLVNGEPVMLGVPYGPTPRLILMYVMTQAIKSKMREIELASSFRDWLRSLGKKSFGGGERGQMSLVRQHLDRLMHCEWTIKWEGQETDKGRPFAIEQISLMKRAAGYETDDGVGDLRITLTQDFFESLVDHPVPFNWVAVKHMSSSAMALDLYTYLAHRLPRVGNRPVHLSWQQLKVHFGTDTQSMTRFRQMVRQAWENFVSPAYPEALVDFSGRIIKLEKSPPPIPFRTVAGGGQNKRLL